MPRTNLNDITVFMAVVDSGSFVAGGQALGMTRSAAGKAVMRLEDRLGVRLLNRTTRTLSLTDEGRAFYDRGLQIFAAIEDAEASVASRAGTPRGVLRLTVPDAFGRRVILPLLRKYLRAWPDVQVEVSFTDRVVDIIEEGFDLAVRIGVTDPDSRLVSRVVAGTARCSARLLPTSPSGESLKGSLNWQAMTVWCSAVPPEGRAGAFAATMVSG
ncbi:LysR family transcriptional regulator [Cystobacter fuscus]